MAFGIRNTLRSMGRSWRLAFARLFLVASIGEACDLRPGCVIEGGKPRPGQPHKGIILGKGVVLYPGVVLTTDAYSKDSGITIGDGTWINRNSLIYGGGHVKIGKDVLIGPCVVIWSGGHRLDVSSGPVKDSGLTLEPVIIEDGAWLGACSVILQGVTIGAGAVVGAGSVVNKDVPAGSIVAGNPARVVRMRGDEGRE